MIACWIHQLNYYTQLKLSLTTFRNFIYLMSEKSPEELRYLEVLNSPGLELKGFYTEPPINLFPKAASYPDFFNYNLLSPHRVIKCLRNDPHSNIRVFYFNLFRLSYYLEGEHGLNKIFLHSLRNYILHPQFEILFTIDSDSQRQIYNDSQFKKLFAEFLYLLDIQEAPDIEHILNSFPIIDIVMIHILRSVLANQGHDEEFTTKIPTDVVLVELSALFGLSLTTYGNCWKFEDSDVFCLEHSEDQLFIAYVEEVILEDPGEIPIQSDKLISKDAISLDMEQPARGKYVINTAPVGEFVATNSTPYSSASRYAGQQIHLQPRNGTTNSVPLISNNQGQLSSNSYSQSSHHIVAESHPLSKFAKYNQIMISDPSPPISQQDINSLKVLQQLKNLERSKNQGKDDNNQQDNNQGLSTVSLVSDTYEFVDFLNTKTVYKDKVPRNKLGKTAQSKTLPKEPINQHTLDDLPKGNLFDMAKNLEISPIYHNSPNTNTYDLPYTNYEPLKFDPIAPTAFQITPTYDIPRYEPPLITSQLPKYSAPLYQLPSFTQPKPQILKPSLPLYNYEPAYQSTSYKISEPIVPVLTTQSYNTTPAQIATPFTKTNTKHSYGESYNVSEPKNTLFFQPEVQNKPVYQPPMTISITASTVNKELGDYYKDFTNSFMLEKMDEPFRTNIRAIKNRMKGLKRGGVTPNTFTVNQPIERTSISLNQAINQGGRFY